MEKYKVDYSELSYFKGITIDFDYLEEGLDYAQRHRLGNAASIKTQRY